MSDFKSDCRFGTAVKGWTGGEGKVQFEGYKGVF
jgi:hypothetical protein